jgi:hypothetical protein
LLPRHFAKKNREGFVWEVSAKYSRKSFCNRFCATDFAKVVAKMLAEPFPKWCRISCGKPCRGTVREVLIQKWRASCGQGFHFSLSLGGGQGCFSWRTARKNCFWQWNCDVGSGICCFQDPRGGRPPP